MAQRWGDVLDDDSDDDEIVVQQQIPSQTSAGGGLVIPPTHKSRIDSKGIQIITSYRQHPTVASQLMKTITKVKVNMVKVREAKAVEERRKWKKFGEAVKDDSAGPAQRSTIISKDDIFMEDPNADTDLQDEDPTAQLGNNLNEFWAKQKRRELQRKYDVGGDEGGDGGGWTHVGAGGGTASATAGKYVPPSQRAAMASGVKPERRTDDLNTIRVTNISENTTEADLQDLFKPFGRISRVYLAKDKETLQSRGFAFVSFVNKDDAAEAMEKLQGHGYDHLILKLEWARPNTPKDPATSGNEYRSGYGKALAQDTKEKVSYASNLTR
ncbi:RRM domain containing RNA-binding protein [Nitzschia inconspicua]|uniref:Eukaryotic translation initiation factor 3 subunit G n=1 Tax=Nitzschia inconspicua TaxID=303405 RepID=A0A9K3LSH7_9STRA|nr:RRM domain containing RNA-binding protein [Nitzschia inconspicua]